MAEFWGSNPFLGNSIVHDAKMFFGRDELFRWVYAILAAPGSVALLGPPRIGKGSFLYCLRFPEMQQRYARGYAEQLKRYLFVFMDIRLYAHRSWDDFFKALNKEIVNQCRGVINLSATSYEGSEGFVALLDEITDQSYHPVLSFDSFEKLRENERLSGLLPSFLRSEVYRVSYAIASTIPLDEIFVHEPLQSPFYNIFMNRKIGALARADACALVTVTAKEAGLPFSEREANWIVTQGGGHPFFLRLISQFAFEKKAAAPDCELDLEQLEAQVYQELLQHFRSLWGSMGEQRREQMCYQLREMDTPDFYDSMLFRRFVRAQCGHEITIELEDIKYALKRIGDLSALGESRLRHLEMVRARLAGNAQPTPSEIGFSIREVLTEAYNSLKGEGVRTDLATDWEAYNILYYCYFKHRTTINALSMRLGVSQRTLHRKKEEAFNKLLIVLREMEGKNRPL